MCMHLFEKITGMKSINTRNPKGQESLIMSVCFGFNSWLSTPCLFIILMGSFLTFCECWNQARPIFQDGKMRNLANKCLQNVHDTNEMHGLMLAPTLCPRKTSHYQHCMSRVIYFYFFHLYIISYVFHAFYELCILMLPEFPPPLLYDKLATELRKRLVSSLHLSND